MSARSTAGPGDRLSARVGGPGGDARRPLAPPNGAPSAPPARPVGPRFEYEMKFFGRLTANLRAEVIGETPEGYRINFYITGGSIVGPDIEAVVRPEGGDWMAIRPDGMGMVDINITFETSDGALVLEQAGGVFQLGQEGLARVKRGEFVGAPAFYATPRWETASAKWAFLNRSQGFGIGRVVLEELQAQCDIYHPFVGRRLDT